MTCPDTLDIAVNTTITRSATIEVIAVSGELDAVTVPILQRELEARETVGLVVQLDLSRVTFASSAALGLLGAHRYPLTAASRAVMRLLEIQARRRSSPPSDG
jgi:anti-anti-sigma factor